MQYNNDCYQDDATIFSRPDAVVGFFTSEHPEEETLLFIGHFVAGL